MGQKRRAWVGGEGLDGVVWKALVVPSYTHLHSFFPPFSPTPPSIFFGGKKQVLSQRDREALVEKWGDKVQKVEEEAFHLFSSLDRYACTYTQRGIVAPCRAGRGLD
jgi:hypothetical protein